MADAPKYRVEREVYQSKMRIPEEADAVAYRAVSGLALLGLLLGVFSAVALMVPLLWIAAIAGVIVNVVALRRIATHSPALIGRKAALVGVTLSAIFFAAIPADLLTYRWLLRDEARKYAATWFDYLRAGEPHKAYELTVGPMIRDRVDDSLWEFFREGSDERSMLVNFLRKPAVGALMALKDKATVRYYDTESQWSEKETDHVYQTYAVTYPDSEGLKTFFVGLVLDRTAESHTKHAFWQITRIDGGVKPKWLGGSGAPPKL
jgi:hypothetical protein